MNAKRAQKVPSSQSLSSLQRDLLPRIFVFLTVQELCTVECVCQFFYKESAPLAWVKIADRAIPCEAVGGPSQTLPAKDRVRRWFLATCYADKQGTWFNRSRREETYSQFHQIDKTKLRCGHTEFFVRLTRTTEQGSGPQGKTILTQGFVHPSLFDTDGLVNLSVDSIFALLPEAQELLSIISTYEDSPIIRQRSNRPLAVLLGNGRPVRESDRHLYEISNGLFSNLLLTVAMVDRTGTCSHVLVTKSPNYATVTIRNAGMWRVFEWCSFYFYHVLLCNKEGFWEKTLLFPSLFARRSRAGVRLVLKIESLIMG